MFTRLRQTDAYGRKERQSEYRMPLATDIVGVEKRLIKVYIHDGE